MAKTEVPTTGEVLAWAMGEAGVNDAELAKRAKVGPQDVAAWRRGSARPGKTEFAAILAAVRRPSAIFFMPRPPVTEAMPTNFRSAPGLLGRELSSAALREIRRARRVQKAVGWLYEGSDRSAVDLPVYDWSATDPLEVGAQVRESFGVSMAEQASWQNMAEGLRQWRARFDDRGVLTFSLTLGRNEIRGFSAWDDYAPLIAVNTTDYAEGARIYTLAHELAHLVTRTDSACFDWISPAGASDPKLERWCEQFAATFLLPPAQFKGFLAYRFSIDAQHQVTDFQTTWDLSRRLKVSARALALALIESDLASAYLYDPVDTQAVKVDRPPVRKSGGLGERNPEKRIRQYGVRAPATLVDAVASGQLGPRDAADYLELNLGDLQDLGSLLRDRPAVGA